MDYKTCEYQEKRNKNHYNGVGHFSEVMNLGYFCTHPAASKVVPAPLARTIMGLDDGPCQRCMYRSKPAREPLEKG